MSDETRYDIVEEVTPGATWNFSFVVTRYGVGEVADWTDYNNWEIYIFRKANSAGPTQDERRAASLFGGDNTYLTVENGGIVEGTPPDLEWTVDSEQSAAVPPGERYYEIWVEFEGAPYRVAHGTIPVTH